MFEKSGKLIKGYARVVFPIKCVLFGVLAIVLFIISGDKYGDEQTACIIYGFVALLAGPFVAWLSSLFMHAFGVLAEANTVSQPVAPEPKIPSNRTIRLMELLNEKLITEEEYNQKIKEDDQNVF